MRYRNILPISLLALALAAPAAMAHPSPGAAFVDQGNKNKDKNKDKNKNKGRQEAQDDWNREWDRDWDDDDGNMRFRGMDRNGDGRITRGEWRGNDNSFDNHDWNRDGVLSGEEVRPGGRRGEDDDDRWTSRFDRLDLNDDGFLSRSEWTGDDRVFERLDRNNDGRLSLNELRSRDFDRGDLLDERFRESDLNRDGRLSLSEWWGRDEAFERLDRNNDGYLSRTEVLSPGRDWR